MVAHLICPCEKTLRWPDTVLGKLDFFKAEGGIGKLLVNPWLAICDCNSWLSLSSFSSSGAGRVAVVCATRAGRWYPENAKEPPVEALRQCRFARAATTAATGGRMAEGRRSKPAGKPSWKTTTNWKCVRKGLFNTEHRAAPKKASFIVEWEF